MAQTVSTPNPIAAALPRADMVLESAEESVVVELWNYLAARDDTRGEEGKAALIMALVRLEKIWEAIEVHPSILRGQTLGARHTDVRSLIETLSTCNPYSTEAFLPTRGALVRAFLHAKLNFCRFLGHLVTELLGDDPGASASRPAIERIQTSAVCNVMAEDILRLIASDHDLALELRRKATWVLVQMWEDRACHVVPRFFPVLDSVWQAKTQVTVSYGTLSGASELLDIIAEGCDPTFLDCFALDSVSDDEVFALQEFMFNFSYEHLQQLQAYMAETGELNLDAGRVATILKLPADDLHIQTCTCEEMIFTFRERQSMANHRRALDLPGPKRTAEGYLMVHLLENAGDVEGVMCGDEDDDTPEITS